jgi:hypothetical protein
VPKLQLRRNHPTLRSRWMDLSTSVSLWNEGPRSWATTPSLESSFRHAAPGAERALFLARVVGARGQLQDRRARLRPCATPVMLPILVAREGPTTWFKGPTSCGRRPAGPTPQHWPRPGGPSDASRSGASKRDVGSSPPGAMAKVERSPDPVKAPLHGEGAKRAVGYVCVIVEKPSAA